MYRFNAKSQTDRQTDRHFQFIPLLIFPFFTTNLSAQLDLVSIDETSTTFVLDSSQLVYVNNLLNMDGVIDYQYVEVDDIIDNQQDGKFTFSADSISTKNVRATKVDFEDANKYSWHGSTYDGLFTMIINKNSNGFSGTIIDDEEERFYRLFAIDSTKSIMLEFGETSNQLSCPHETTTTSGSPPTGLENCDDICPGNIDILFLLPQETQDWLVSEENYLSYIQLMISDLEMAWTNSQVVHTVDYTWAPYDWVNPALMLCKTDAVALANDPQAQLLRTNNNADIVILLAPPLTEWIFNFSLMEVSLILEIPL